ncbi:MAG TPA: rhodanese-like domain-containing protein [Polyangiales bacterium]|nr:rhodanese-like domain-containing protein [Polyangiales bacterium]
MTISSISAREVRAALLLRRELALFDLGNEDTFAKDHPLFASQLDVEHAHAQLPARLPRRDAPVVLYDRGEGAVEKAAAVLRELGHTHVYRLQGGLHGWRSEGYELFQDVNSYSKAFGELVESRRHTPSVSAEQLQQLLDSGADLAVLDARRFDEYNTMSIPSGTSVPGAELVLRARELAPDPKTTVVVNCAGRTRSIIGAQSLINAGLPNKVVALRNGTIGWTLAGQKLEHGQTRKVPQVRKQFAAEARERARTVAYRAGVKRIGSVELAQLQDDATRTLYRFDVRTPEEYAEAHLPGFRSTPGGQLVQETDMVAPVRGARIVLSDLAAPGEEALGVRADMSASWLAQLGWEVYVLSDAAEARESGNAPVIPRDNAGRYKRPYEGTDNPRAAMQAYLEWEYGLVAQLARDGSHGFYVI